MPHRQRSRSLIALLATLALLIPSYSIVVAPVSAHCPSGPTVWPPLYTTGTKTITSNEGVEGVIQWTNPTVCTPSGGTATTNESITTCDYQCHVGRDGWIQVGWIKQHQYSEPRWYCELAASQGGSGFGEGLYLIQFGTTAGTYSYSGLRSYTPYDAWTCLINGSVKAQKLTSWMGFAYADRLYAGGETNSTHTQMGKMYPPKLLISGLRYIMFGSYVALSVSCCGTSASIYGMDKPATDSIRNWTTSH